MRTVRERIFEEPAGLRYKCVEMTVWQMKPFDSPVLVNLDIGAGNADG